MKNLKADRRLMLTAKKDQVVEEGDPRAAFLLAAPGRVISGAEAKRLGLEVEDGRIGYPEGPAIKEGRAAVMAAEELEEEEASGKVLYFGGGDSSDDSDRNDEAPPEWTDRRSPEKYLELYPDGPNADLARSVIAAQEDGADGVS